MFRVRIARRYLQCSRISLNLSESMLYAECCRFDLASVAKFHADKNGFILVFYTRVVYVVILCTSDHPNEEEKKFGFLIFQNRAVLFYIYFRQDDILHTHTRTTCKFSSRQPFIYPRRRICWCAFAFRGLLPTPAHKTPQQHTRAGLNGLSLKVLLLLYVIGLNICIARPLLVYNIIY